MAQHNTRGSRPVRGRRLAAVVVATSLFVAGGGAAAAWAEPTGVRPANVGTGGTVTAWGTGNAPQNLPAGLTGVTAIATGSDTSMALKTDGTIVTWGNSNNPVRNVPTGLTGVTAIAEGQNFALALKSDGTVVTWGDNGNGQLNMPTGLTGVTAISAGAISAMALKSDGTVVAWGYNGYGQSNVPGGLTGVTAISSGQFTDLALKADGTVVAWGGAYGCYYNCSNDFYGTARVPAGLTGVTAISAGNYNSLALKSDGTVVAWGGNDYYNYNYYYCYYYGGSYCNYTSTQFAPPSGLTGVTAISAGFYTDLALKSDGTVVSWGPNNQGIPNPPADLHNVTAIAAGIYGNVALVGVAPTFTADAAPSTIKLQVPFTTTFAAIGSPTPKFSVSSGSLPTGVTLDPISGIASGTPTTVGIFAFTVTASNGVTPSAVGTPHIITVTKADQAITFTSTAPSPTLVGGTHYGVTASGGGSNNLVVVTVDPASTNVCALTGTPATVAFTAAGSCVLDANQAGNDTYTAAPQVQQVLNVVLAPSTTTTTASPASVGFGAPVTISSGVTPAAVNDFVPTGTVTFTLDGGTASLMTATLAAKKPTFTTSGLAAGAHTITTSYSGDNHFAPSTTTTAVLVTTTLTLTGVQSGPILVPAGTTLLIRDATLLGRVVVAAGGAIDIENSTLTRGFSAVNSGAVRLCGSNVKPSFSVTGATGLVNVGNPGADACKSNTFTGALTLVKNTGGLGAIGNVITGVSVITGNSGAGAYPGDNNPRVSDNTSTAATPSAKTK